MTQDTFNYLMTKKVPMMKKNGGEWFKIRITKKGKFTMPTIKEYVRT